MKKFVISVLLLIASVNIQAQSNVDEALAVQYFQSGDFEKAATVYERLYSRTRNPAYYDPLFSSLIRVKRYSEAEELARRLHKANPNNHTYAVDIGRVYQEKGEQQKATEWFDKLVRELPANEFAVKDLAITFYRAEAYEHSIKAFMNGRKLLNDDSAFSYDLLSLYRFRKDKPNLIQEYLVVLKTNPDILLQAQNVLANILEDKADYDLLRAALLRQLQKDPQNIALTEFLTWQYIQQKDFDMALRQTLALDRRLKEDGARVFDLSRVFIANSAYPQAVESLNYLTAKGTSSKYYIPARMDLLDVKARQLTAGKLADTELKVLETEYQSLLNELGRTPFTVQAVRQLAKLQAFHLKKPEEALEQLNGVLKIAGLPLPVVAQVKLELGEVYILTGEVWEATLLFSQVEKQLPNDAPGQEARFKNARLAWYRGDFTWAKAQLDVLRSSTSQLIANDALNLGLQITDNLQSPEDTLALRKYAEADLMIFKNDAEGALRLLDSLNQLFPGNSLADDILMAKARIYLNNNETSKAVQELSALLEKFSSDLWGDDATFMLADIYENKLSQPERALELYQKIITDFPGSLFVAEARKRFRLLRGDKIG